MGSLQSPIIERALARKGGTMRRTLTFTTGIMALVLIGTKAVDATTYWCDASKKNAALAVSVNSAVSITADRSNEECRYSINGETVGSPPRPLVINAHNLLRKSEMTKEINSGNVDPLAYALLASSPLQQIPEALRSILQKHAKNLEACLNALKVNARGTFVSDPSLACRVVATGQASAIGFGKGEIRVQPTTPNNDALLVLGTVGDRALEHYLFVPMFYVSGKLGLLQ